MIRALWRPLGPWAVPVLVAVEVVLVWSGRLGIGSAVIIIVAVEALLAVTVTGRTLRALRRFRADRATGSDGWSAATDALAQLMPRTLSRALLIEAHIWVCLIRWVIRSHDGRSPDAHPYRRDVQTLIVAILALTVVEGGVAELVLTMLLPGTPWPWLVLALHTYAVIWLAGFLASLHTRPHLLGRDGLHLRDSVFGTITVPYAMITRVRPARRSGFGRSGLRIDPTSGTGVLAYGDTTVVLSLDRTGTLHVSGGSTPLAGTPAALRITVDDPGVFCTALGTRLTGTASAATASIATTEPSAL